MAPWVSRKHAPPDYGRWLRAHLSREAGLSVPRRANHARVLRLAAQEVCRKSGRAPPPHGGVQGYLAHKNPWDPTVGPCLGPYGVPRGVDVFLCEVPLYDPFIKSQIASRNQLWGLMWCSHVQVTP